MKPAEPGGGRRLILSDAAISAAEIDSPERRARHPTTIDTVCEFQHGSEKVFILESLALAEFVAGRRYDPLARAPYPLKDLFPWFERELASHGVVVARAQRLLPPERTFADFFGVARYGVYVAYGSAEAKKRYELFLGHHVQGIGSRPHTGDHLN